VTEVASLSRAPRIPLGCLRRLGNHHSAVGKHGQLPRFLVGNKAHTDQLGLPALNPNRIRGSCNLFIDKEFESVGLNTDWGRPLKLCSLQKHIALKPNQILICGDLGLSADHPNRRVLGPGVDQYRAQQCGAAIAKLFKSGRSHLLLRIAPRARSMYHRLPHD